MLRGTRLPAGCGGSGADLSVLKSDSPEPVVAASCGADVKVPRGRFGGRLCSSSRRGARQDGAVAVEFALILSLLLLILLGTIEFGRVYSQLQVFQGAAREGARCAAVSASSSCSIQDKIDSASGAYTPATTASVQVGAGSVVAADSSGAGCTNATVGQDVRVYWAQTLDLDIAFWKSVTITSNVEGVFRCE